MMNLFYEGGPLFMSLLTISFASGIYFAIKRKDDLVASISLFSLVLGVFAQLIGLYSAFLALGDMSNISPQMLYGGLRISMISTLYGILIFILLRGYLIVTKALKKTP